MQTFTRHYIGKADACDDGHAVFLHTGHTLRCMLYLVKLSRPQQGVFSRSVSVSHCPLLATTRAANHTHLSLTLRCFQQHPLAHQPH